MVGAGLQRAVAGRGPRAGRGCAGQGDQQREAEQSQQGNTKTSCHERVRGNLPPGSTNDGGRPYGRPPGSRSAGGGALAGPTAWSASMSGGGSRTRRGPSHEPAVGRPSLLRTGLASAIFVGVRWRLPGVRRRPAGLTRRRVLKAGADPLAHGLLAGAVAAPLARGRGRGPVVTAVVAGTLIDVDHVVAARSLRPVRWLTLGGRPRAHTMTLAVAMGGIAAAVGGPAHGWAAFGGLASHLLRDASDAGGTPILWPVSGRRQIPRSAYAAGVAGLAVGSWLVSRASGAEAAGASSGAGACAAGARPRTA